MAPLRIIIAASMSHGEPVALLAAKRRAMLREIYIVMRPASPRENAVNATSTVANALSSDGNIAAINELLRL